MGGISTHTIRFEFHWDTPNGARVFFFAPCWDSTVYGSGGSIIINIPSAQAGLYMFEPQVNEAYGEGPNMNVSYGLYQDDSLMDSASATLAPYGGCCWTVWPGINNFFQFRTAYYSGFKLYVFATGGLDFIGGETSGNGGSASLDLQGFDNCAGTTWTPDSDIVTFTIISGTQYVSFYKSGIKLGSSATATESSISGLTIVPDGLPPDSTGDSIIVLAQSGAVTSQDTILLEPPYLDHFEASYYPNMQQFMENPIFLEPLNMYGHDVTVPDTMHLDITPDSAGMRYGDLFLGSNEGKSFEGVTWDSLSSAGLAYIADGDDLLQPAEIHIMVTVPGQNVKPTDIAIQVSPEPVVVTITPPDILPGDTATITLKQRNADGSLSDFPPNQEYEIGLSSGENDGNILLSDGSTGGYFSYVSQPFRFIAADSIGGDSAVAVIQVGTQHPMLSSAKQGTRSNNGQSAAAPAVNALKDIQSTIRDKSAGRAIIAASSSGHAQKGVSLESSGYNFTWANFGIGMVVVKQNYMLKILNHAPWSIWPYLPATRGGTTRGGDLPGYDPNRTFEIQVTDANGNPVNGAIVEITHNFLQGSGGHVHGASGELLPRPALQGIFYGQGDSGPSLTLTTDPNGIALVDKYLASQISGTYLITAYLKSDPFVKDTVNLNVQVPGLVNFRDLIFRPKVEEPYTFAQTAEYGPNHTNNDWCTPVMGDSLFAGILDFNFWSASKKGGGIPLKVSINDMSLPWGGAFDYKGNWNVNSEHTFHRVGLSVDINRDGLSDAKIRKLTEIMRQYGGLRNPEEPIHYGFFNGGN